MLDSIRHPCRADRHRVRCDMDGGACPGPDPVSRLLCSTLYDQTERYRNLSGRVPANRGHDVLKEHRQLMDAALARNADRACELIARHFQSITNIILASGVVGEQGQKAQPVRRKTA